MYQPCYVCRKIVKPANYIALDDFGDPQICCEECYDRAKIFFVRNERRNFNGNIRRSNEDRE